MDANITRNCRALGAYLSTRDNPSYEVLLDNMSGATSLLRAYQEVEGDVVGRGAILSLFLDAVDYARKMSAIYSLPPACWAMASCEEGADLTGETYIRAVVGLCEYELVKIRRDLNTKSAP